MSVLVCGESPQVPLQCVCVGDVFLAVELNLFLSTGSEDMTQSRIQGRFISSVMFVSASVRSAPHDS